MLKTPFALITGASEGLGRHLAFQCAARGYHLVLVALPNSGLPQLAQFIKEHYGVYAIAIEADLSQEIACQALHRELKERGICINVLINNAGLGGTYFFDQNEADYYSYVIKLNVTTPTVLCRLFLDDLRRSKPSYILNVSSLASFFSLPRKQVYAGTKAYVLTFSRCLRKELKGDGISVSALCPGGINTSWQLTLQHRTTTNWLARQSFMNPDIVAAIAVQQMLAGKEVIIPGAYNRAFKFFNPFLPAFIKNRLMDRQMKKLHHIRHLAVKPAA